MDKHWKRDFFVFFSNVFGQVSDVGANGSTSRYVSKTNVINIKGTRFSDPKKVGTYEIVKLTCDESINNRERIEKIWNLTSDPVIDIAPFVDAKGDGVRNP